MKYDEISQFPAKIDPLIFFSDVSISLKNDMDAYDDLIAQNKFTDAKNLMDASNIHGYVASLFNLMENRIYSVQNHLVNVLPPPNRATNFLITPEEFSSELFHETIWTGGDKYTYVLDDDIEFASTSTPVKGKNWIDTDVTPSHLIAKDDIDQQVVNNAPTNYSLNTIWIGTEK